MLKPKQLFLFFALFNFIITWGQEPYNNCAQAIELCPSTTFSLNNINANATVCSNCEDDFNFCFSGGNSIWMKFTTNNIGGEVTVDFNQIVFENLTGQGNQLQAAIIEATIPCISSSYSLVSNCVDNGSGSFSLSMSNLPPNTTYYVVVSGAMGTTDYAEAHFDVLLSGTGADRNPSFSIGTNTDVVCAGNTVVFFASTEFCDEQSIFDWYLNGELIGSTLDSVFIYSDLLNNDVVTAKVSCFNQCRDTLISNALSFAVIDFLVDAGPDYTIQKGESVQIQGQTTESHISWTPSYNMNNSTVINPVVLPDQTTTYFLTVDNGTCSITDEMTVFVENELEIPNTFSPNGDGINDTWDILGIQNFPDCHIQIFTRWGQLVYQTTGYSKEKRWNGQSKTGKEVPPGAYFYVINLRDQNYEKPIKGTVSLIR